MKAPITQERKTRIAKLHIAKAQLKLDDESYRDILRRITKKDSSSACSASELDLLLAEMKRLGFADKHVPASSKAYVRMIYGLWTDLRPYVSDSSRAALRRFVRRQTATESNPRGVSAPEFLTPEEGARIIEALKGWRARESQKAAPRNDRSRVE